LYIGSLTTVWSSDG